MTFRMVGKWVIVVFVCFHKLVSKFDITIRTYMPCNLSGLIYIYIHTYIYG